MEPGMFISSGVTRTELHARGRKVVRRKGKQVLLLDTDGRVFAIANRCPHEGYPLSEGTLGPDCLLTCNWHNWKFDLATGAALVGRDPVRTYPVELRGDDIFVDLADPPAEAQRERALKGLESAIADTDMARMARAVALARGALAEGLEYNALRPAFAEAALAHYADFGHCAIYTFKTGQLISRLGGGATEPLLLALTRMLARATREERLPEFRFYAKALAAWDGTGGEPARTHDFVGASIDSALKRTLASSGRETREIYDALLGA